MQNLINKILAIQKSANKSLAQASSLEDAIPKILESICVSLNWDAAIFWSPDDEGKKLKASFTWHVPSSSSLNFIKESCERTFTLGEGLPGRVWASAETAWISDLAQDTNFPRADAARKDGFKAAAAFPIISDNRVLGVLEFCSKSLQPEDNHLSQMMSLVGDQIGQFLKIQSALNKVRQNEARKRAVQEISLDCIIGMDIHGRITEVNPAGEKIFGFKANEVIGKEMADVIIPKRFREAHWNGLNHYLKTGEGPVLNKRIEVPALRSDGSEIMVELAITNIDAKPPYFIGFIRDISERKNAELLEENYKDGIKNQSKWLEAILNLTPTPIVIIEPGTGNLIFANTAANNMAGGKFPVSLTTDSEYYFADLNGQRIPEEEQPLRRVANGENLDGEQVDWMGPDKHSFLIIYSQFLPEMFGQADSIIISFNDVTQLKKTEFALEEAIRARDEFLSIASHELKTPLTSLQLQADMLARNLKKGIPTQERLQKMIEDEKKGIMRLTRLVDDMLDISRISTGKLTIQREEFDLCELTKEIVERYEAYLEQENSKVFLSMNEAITGYWDRLRIEQVLTNLLTNAIKYGAGKPVHIKIFKEDNMAKVVIQDQGMGIAEENKERIFERFERAVSGTAISGLGLGLFIVKNIVEMHKGTIKVESEANKGSTFTVEIPLKI